MATNKQTKDLKNQKIKESISLTREKRKNQVCSVYQVKIQENKLTQQQKEHLKMMFVEAKWIINSVLSFSNESENNKIWDYKLISNKVKILDKDKNEIEKELKYIGSQMKQSVIAEMISNIRTLSSLKKNGNKVGKLKYRKECKSINLKQYFNTYKFISNNKMKIQGVPGKVYVNGLNQFIKDKDIEYANAKILNTPNGYYLAITTFKNKDKIIKKDLINEEIGIDFGIKNNLTLSNGKNINVSIEESERLKRLQKKLSRQQKSSNNRRKTIVFLRKEYQTISNKKQDTTNKIVSDLLKYKTIYIQDENLSGWKENGFGKQIQHSILGRIKSKLINKKEQVIVVDRYKPTTKCCSQCLKIKEEISIQERMYICDFCGHGEDRDLNSAKNMILFGKNIVPAERRKVKPVEKNVSFSLMQEAHKL